MRSRLMRYRGRSNSKEDGKRSKERKGEERRGRWERGRGGWLVMDNEGTETPNGMHLLH